MSLWTRKFTSCSTTRSTREFLLGVSLSGDRQLLRRQGAWTAFANWYEIQAREEQDHAMLFLPLPAQQQPAGGAGRASPGPETHFTDLIGPPQGRPGARAVRHRPHQRHLRRGGGGPGDYRTVQFLDWFIKEQGEEEKNSADQITKMELYGGDARSLYMLNSELLAPHLHRPVPDVGVRRARRARIHNRSAGRMAPGKKRCAIHLTRSKRAFFSQTPGATLPHLGSRAPPWSLREGRGVQRA